MSMAHMLGIPHERRFDLDTAIYCWWDGWWPDCAWQAAPHVADILKRGGTVIQLVRNPLHVVTSLLDNQHWLIQPGRETPYERYGRQYFEDKGWESKADLELAFWVQWNSMIESAGVIPRVRIEDVGNAAHLNHRQNTEDPVQWCDFEDESLVRDAKQMAERYGYYRP
jgi:hypothetical protein